MSEVVSHTDRGGAPSTASVQQEAPPCAPVKRTRGRAPRPDGYKRLYSIPEAADYLGRSAWSVRRLVWAGELPQVRAGGRVHLDVKDMEAFIEHHKVRG